MSRVRDLGHQILTETRRSANVKRLYLRLVSLWYLCKSSIAHFKSI